MVTTAEPKSVTGSSEDGVSGATSLMVGALPDGVPVLEGLAGELGDALAPESLGA